jgi:hypothetical protein
MFSSAFVCFVLGAFTGSTAAQTFPYDHIHLNVPDPAAAANWYEKYFGARRLAGHCLEIRRLPKDPRRSEGRRRTHPQTW